LNRTAGYLEAVFSGAPIPDNWTLEQINAVANAAADRY
jgi:hypothetical protein